MLDNRLADNPCRAPVCHTGDGLLGLPEETKKRLAGSPGFMR